jgi:DNA invertase Pin-like site-specific DNA recombinase
MTNGPSDTPVPVPAVVYVRMSTEKEQSSHSSQMDVIREYASRRGMQIIEECSDEGNDAPNIGPDLP